MPGIVILEYPVEASKFGLPTGVEIAAERMTSGERHLVLSAGSRRLRICIRHTPSRGVPVFVVAVDDHSARRLAATAIAEHVLWRPGASGPTASIPTPYQRHRLVRMLAVHDALRDGASMHDIAFGLIFPRDPPLNGAVWKGSGERRHAHRLVAELRQMIDGGYRKLLLSG